MVAFFKRDIAAWMDGTENLSDGAYRAYDVICNLIYLSEGPITLNERGIAGRCRQRLEDFRRYLRQLTEAKKIVIVDGKVFNRRCADELAKIEQKRGNSSRGGQVSAARRSPPAQPPPTDGSVPANERLPDNILKKLPSPQVTLALDETRKDYYPPTPQGGGTPFKEFFGGWGTQSDDQQRAEAVWAELSEPDRKAAIAGIAGYFAELRRIDRKPVAAAKYLAQRRWTGTQPQPKPEPKTNAERNVATDRTVIAGSGAMIMPGTPQWEAWKQAYTAAGNLEILGIMRSREEFRKPVKVASEFPPAMAGGP